MKPIYEILREESNNNKNTINQVSKKITELKKSNNNFFIMVAEHDPEGTMVNGYGKGNNKTYPPMLNALYLSIIKRLNTMETDIENLLKE